MKQSQKIEQFLKENPKYITGHYKEAAEKLGVPYDAVRSVARRLQGKKEKPKEQPSKASDKTSFDQTGNTAELESNGRIKTLQQLIDTSNINLDEWEIERHVINKWDMTNAEGTSYENWQVKAWMKKIAGGKEDWKKLEKSIINVLNSHSPVYKPYPRYKNGDHLLVIDPADVHFGKYASAYETGEEYNIEIARQRLKEGVFGIVEKTKSFNVEKILLILGNDWLHIDTPKSTTTSGTFQDSDGMFHTMYLALYETMVEIIDTLLVDFDIDVEFNASNHDFMSGWMFCKTLEAHYRLCKNINFSSSISHRKYYKYGTNLIATSHGDGAKMQDMPLLMANEAPLLWSETKYRYVYLHHIHHKQVTKFQSGKDYIGVTVEYLRSPSSSDSWHFRNGYVGAKKAIEGFLHSKEDGQIARITHYVG
jgi:hypothetical protein